MDSRSAIDSVVTTVQSLGKDWVGLGHHVPPYIRRKKHRTGEQGGGPLTDESGQEQKKKERCPDGTTTRDHPEGFEVIV